MKQHIFENCPSRLPVYMNNSETPIYYKLVPNDKIPGFYDKRLEKFWHSSEVNGGKTRFDRWLKDLHESKIETIQWANDSATKAD